MARWRILEIWAVLFLAFGSSAAEPPTNWIANGSLEQPDKTGKAPEGFQLAGDAVYDFLGDNRRERVGQGVWLISGRDVDRDGDRAGSVSTTLRQLKTDESRWFRFTCRALPQEGFAVRGNSLILKVAFFANQGDDERDVVSQRLYALIDQQRRDLDMNGNQKRAGAAAWHDYNLDFRLPFPDVDTLRLSVEFRQGSGKGKNSAFLIEELILSRLPEYAIPAPTPQPTLAIPLDKLVSLGGKWYYYPSSAEPQPPEQFDHTNADRLLYHDGKLQAPFAANMSAWLREGYLDRAGDVVRQERAVPDNLVISFTATHMVVHAKNLPNHATAVFPNRGVTGPGNPHYIQEQNRTYYLPLTPTVNHKHIAMDKWNRNRALNGGPIGIAINGVVFYNPFDADMEDATSIMDTCCGHPSPDNMYHYHKYPICVKSPWADEGKEHSPLIGFALDGFPIYGPYEEAGVMAKDLKKNRLNDFNVHHDDQRGWHYHVTPGKFPYVIGGYWGEVEERNRRRGGPPRGPGGAGGPPAMKGERPDGKRPPRKGPPRDFGPRPLDDDFGAR